MKPDKPSTEYKSPTPTPNPLKPRPRLLLILSILFLLWVAFLLTMYFTTVYPHRHIEARPSAVARAACP